MSPLPPHIRRRKPNPLAGQILGVYKGPPRTGTPVKLTEYRARLLDAIGNKEIKRGQDSFAGQWRWRGVTVTKSVQPLIANGWAAVVGKHLELTQAGRDALDTGGTP